MTSSLKKQQGIGHIGVIVAVAAIAIVAFVGWLVWQNNNSSSTASEAVQEAIKNAKCDYDDKDLCKFLNGWKAQTAYSATSTSQTDGQTVTTSITVDGDTKSHIKVSGGPLAYETITIGNTVYTKAADGTWWKQTVNATDIDKYKTEGIDFAEPTGSSAEGTVSYKNLGKEKCGELTCFKYQSTSPSDTTTTTYIWFDDDEYLLRHMQTVGQDGTTYSFEFSYKDVAIATPTPVKELGVNQYLVPGQSEPATLPGTGDDMSDAEIDYSQPY